jgi:hypothetical protein
MTRDDEQALGATIDLDGHAVRVGTCSWADKTPKTWRW